MASSPVAPLTLTIIPPSQSNTHRTLNIPSFQYNPIVPASTQPQATILRDSRIVSNQPMQQIPTPQQPHIPPPALGINRGGAPMSHNAAVQQIHTSQQMPTYQQTHIPPPALVINMGRPALPRDATEQEKLEHARRLNREKQKRFREKTKGFVDIARLATLDERLKRVVLLSYPDIYSRISEHELNQHINSLVSSIFPDPSTS